MKTGSRVSWSADLEWLRGLLWPNDELTNVSTRRPPSPGMRTVATFAVLPDSRRPRLLVQLGSSASTRSAFHQFNDGMSGRARITKAIAGTLLSRGPGRSFLGDRLHVDVPQGISAAELDRVMLDRYLAGVLQQEDLTTAISFGSLRPNRKPVLQATSPDGAVIAYAKVGWNELTRAIVANEASALSRWAAVGPRTFDMPGLIHRGTWGGFEIIVTSAIEHLPWRKRRPDDRLLHDAMWEIATMSDVSTLPLAATPMWSDIRSRSKHVGGRVGEQCLELERRFEDRFGDLELNVGSWHGDWAPWNMITRGSRISVWDWERFRDGVPLGLDAAHFAHQTHLTDVHHDHVAAARIAMKTCSPMMRALGVDPKHQPPIFAYYLFELFLRYESATQERVLPTGDPARASILSAIADTVRGADA